MNIPCSTCNARCCRNYIVSITAHDLLRIYEKLNNLEWVDATRVEKNKISPARSFLLPCNGKREEHVLCLKRNGKGRCIFLGKNNLCRIYSFRPMVCREYPFEKKGGWDKVQGGVEAPGGMGA